MNTRRRLLLVLMTVVLTGSLLCGNGCKKTDSAVENTEAKSTVELCVKCGQIKGDESCCDPDAERCIICGLAEESPGCCNIPEGAESAAICTACGNLAGGELCCKPGGARCSKCGLVEKSPGCCKLPKS